MGGGGGGEGEGSLRINIAPQTIRQTIKQSQFFKLRTSQGDLSKDIQKVNARRDAADEEHLAKHGELESLVENVVVVGMFYMVITFLNDD